MIDIHVFLILLCIAGSPAVLVSSPYTSELARLRMDRLRIEEEHLLEIKRQDELERIRGPLPKWYKCFYCIFEYHRIKRPVLKLNPLEVYEHVMCILSYM